MTRYLLGAAVLAAAFSTSAVAQRRPVPIVDYPNIPVATSSGKALSAAAVAEGIKAGAAAGARKWTVGHVAPDKLRLSYSVRTHTISVDVPFSSTGYGILYAESVNMKYELLNGQRVIHPFYNDWVGELRRSIDGEFRKM
jgi:hypothetical protein